MVTSAGEATMRAGDATAKFCATAVPGAPILLGRLKGTKMVMDASRFRRMRGSVWLFSVLMFAGVAFVTYSIWQNQPPGIAPGSHRMTTSWIDGMIEKIGIIDGGKPNLIVTPVLGKPVSVEVDFETTSVFQQGAVLNTSHLRPGQSVRLLHDAVMARSIEIVHQRHIPSLN